MQQLGGERAMDGWSCYGGAVTADLRMPLSCGWRVRHDAGNGSSSGSGAERASPRVAPTLVMAPSGRWKMGCAGKQGSEHCVPISRPPVISAVKQGARYGAYARPVAGSFLRGITTQPLQSVRISISSETVSARSGLSL